MFTVFGMWLSFGIPMNCIITILLTPLSTLLLPCNENIMSIHEMYTVSDVCLSFGVIWHLSDVLKEVYSL
jgi:hypothetical protein